MNLYNKIILKALFLFIAGFFVCCTPQARLNRLLKKHPELKESAIITYTIAPYSIDSIIKVADPKSAIDSILNHSGKLNQGDIIDLSKKLNTLFDTMTRIYRPIKVGNQNGDTAQVYQDKNGVHLKLSNKGKEVKAAGRIPVIRECEHQPLRIFFFGMICGIIGMILFVGWLTKGGRI